MVAVVVAFDGSGGLQIRFLERPKDPLDANGQEMANQWGRSTLITASGRVRRYKCERRMPEDIKF